MLSPLCQYDWCKHCLTSDYLISTETMRVVTFPENANYGVLSDDQKAYMKCPWAFRFPLFIIAHPLVSISFKYCKIENFRVQLSGFLFFLNGGSALLEDTSVSRLDYSSDSAVIWSNSRVTALTLRRVSVSQLNFGRVYYDTSSLCSAFISLTAVDNLLIFDSNFTDNLLLAGTGLEGKNRFIDVKNVLELFWVNNTSVTMTMGGIAVGVNNPQHRPGIADFIVENSVFDMDYSAKSAAVIDISSQSDTLGLIRNCLFRGSNSDSDFPIAKFSMSTDQSVLLVENIDFSENVIAGKQMNSPIFQIVSVGNVTIRNANFTNNGGLQRFDLSYFHYSVTESLLANTSDAYRKSLKTGHCSSVIALTQVLHFALERVRFDGKYGNCGGFLQVSNPKATASGSIFNCEFENGQVTALLFDSITVAVMYTIRYCRFLNNSNSAISFTEAGSPGITGLNITDSEFTGNGAGSQGRGATIAVSASALVLRNVTIRESRGNGGAVVFTLQSSMPLNSAALLSLQTLTFLNSPITGCCLQVQTEKSTAQPLNISIANSSFSIVSGGALSIGRVVIGNGTVADCRFAGKGNTAVDIGSVAGTLQFARVTFQNITASAGGLIFIHGTGASISILSSVIVSITADSILKIDSASVFTQKCTFSNNFAEVVLNVGGNYTDLESSYDNNTGNNGVIYQSAGIVSISRSKFIRNKGVIGPGVAFIQGPNGVFTSVGCKFDGNSGSAQQPGVIFTEFDAVISLNSCEFTNNLGSPSFLSANFLSVAVSISSALISGNTGDYLISLTQAKVTLHSSHIRDNRGSPGIRISSSQVEISDSIIEDLEGGYGCVLFADFFSTITMRSSVVQRVSCGETAIVARESDVRMQAVVVRNVTVRSGANIEAKGGSIVEIADSLFQFLTASSSALTLESIPSISISTSHFTAISCPGLLLSLSTSVRLTAVSISNCTHNSTAFFYLREVATAVIANSDFASVSGGSVGALWVESGSGSVMLLNTTFINCSGSTTGGVYLYTGRLNISDCAFDTCAGLTGGAVFLTCAQDAACNVTNSSFTNNTAAAGGGLYWNRGAPHLINTSFSENEAKYGPDKASSAVSVGPVHSGEISLVSSSQPKSPLEIGIFDAYGQLVATDNTTEVALVSASIDLSLGGQTVAKAVAGVCRFENYTLRGAPGTTVYITAQSSLPDRTVQFPAGLHQTYPLGTFPVSLRTCVMGEIIVDNSACEECASETYSLSDNATLCLPCIATATCKGGTRVYAKAGYWRPYNWTDRVFECPNSETCLGEAERNGTESECLQGYEGNLCQSCRSDFSRTSADHCTPCPSLPLVVLQFLGMQVLAGTLVAWTVFSALKSAQKSDDMQSVFLKVVLNYLQLTGMIATFTMKWPELMIGAFRYQSFVGETTGQAFNFDCFPSLFSNIPRFYQKVIVSCLLPAVLLLLISILWGMVLLLSKGRKSISTQYSVTLVVTLFLIHPDLMRLFVSALNCEELMPGELWVKAELSLQCWQAQHNTYAIGAALPGLLAWCIGIPSISLLYLIRARKRLKTTAIRSVFGFLYVGYKDSAYYWEFVVLLRKVCLVAVAVLLGRISLLGQALTVLLVLFLSFVVTLYELPFQYQKLNSLELCSVFASGVTVIGGMYFLTGEVAGTAHWGILYAVVGVNAAFLAAWLWAYFLLLNAGMVGKFPRLCGKWGVTREIRTQAKRILEQDEYLTDIEHYHSPGLEAPPTDLKTLYLAHLRIRR